MAAGKRLGPGKQVLLLLCSCGQASLGLREHCGGLMAVLPGKTSLMRLVRRSTISSTAASPSLSSATCGVSSLKNTTERFREEGIGLQWEESCEPGPQMST